MERHEILEMMSELKLYGMRAAYDEIAGDGAQAPARAAALSARRPPDRAERTSQKQARSISYRIAAAKLPLAKDLDEFVFTDTPVRRRPRSRPHRRRLPRRQQRNVVFIGGTEPDS